MRKLDFAMLFVLPLLILVPLPRAAQSQAQSTLGLTTVGSTVDVFDSNFMTGSRVVVGASPASVTSVSVYVGAIDSAPRNQFSVAIYSDSGGSPSALVAQSSNGTLSAGAWNTLSVTASLNANTAYWLIYNTNGGNQSVNNLAFDNASSNVGAWAARTFGSWPASFGSSSLATQRYSIYATVQGSTPVPTSTPTLTPTPGSPTATATPGPPTATPTSTPVPAAVPGSSADPALVWSPYAWRDAGTYRESNPQNATVEFEFSQTDSLAVDLDIGAYAGITQSDWPAVQWSVDYGPWNLPVTAAAGASVGGNVRRITIAPSLSTGVWHHVLLWTSSNGNQSHWTGLQQRVQRFVRTNGSALTSTRRPTYTWPKNVLVFGDSISEFSGGDTWPAPGHFHWPVGVARALSANLGLIAYEGQGWRVPPTGGGAAFHVPGDAVNQSWRWYSQGQSRLNGTGLLSPPPDYVIVSFGTNDQGGQSPAAVQASAADWLTGIRTASGPNARIFVLVPFGQWFSQALAAAVSASGDTRAYLLDLGPEQAQGLSGLNVPYASWRSADTEHPNADVQAEISARVVAAIRDALQGAPP